MKQLLFGQQRKIRQQVLLLTSLLNRWCQVREDLIGAFSKCMQADLDSGLKKAIQDMLTRIRGGMSIEAALSQFQKYSTHDHFQDLVASMRLNLRYRGNLPNLLENMELQLNRLESEYQQRQISNAADFRLALLVIAAVPLLIALRMFTVDGLWSMISSAIGIPVAIGCLISYLIAIVFLMKIRIQLTQ